MDFDEFESQVLREFNCLHDDGAAALGLEVCSLVYTCLYMSISLSLTFSLFLSLRVCVCVCMYGYGSAGIRGTSICTAIS